VQGQEVLLDGERGVEVLQPPGIEGAFRQPRDVDPDDGLVGCLGTASRTSTLAAPRAP
jgi:hypothetical protein